MNPLLKLLPIITKAFTKDNLGPSTALSAVLGPLGLAHYANSGDALEAGVLVAASIVMFFIRQYKEEKLSGSM